MSRRMIERRQRTIDEIVQIAIDVMSLSGAAGLSMGEIAKRMGMQTPSLYGYFASKAALCDEVFARGWRDLADTMRPHYLAPAAPAAIHKTMVAGMAAFVGWALEHRAAAELMFWRPIAGWEPTAEAFASAVEHNALLTTWLLRMQSARLLRDDIDADELANVLIVISAGVITQQLANEPGVSVGQGRFSSHIDVLVQTYLSRYGARHD